MKFERFREPCGTEPAACLDAMVTGWMKIGTRSYAVEKNVTKGHLDRDGEDSQACGQKRGVVGGRITQAIMEIFAREEWAKVEEATGMIIPSSGLTATPPWQRRAW